MSKLFSKEKINTKRQIEVDLLRGFTTLILIVCHVGLYLGPSDCIPLYVFADIIGSECGAPVFMTMMGISIVYSKHNNPKDLLIRGIKLFILGYIISFVRTLLPRFILGNIDEWTSIESFFVVDIMQFAGLSFIVLSLFKKLRLPCYISLIISLVLVFICQFIIDSGYPSEIITIPSYFLNLLVPITYWSCFPFMIWFFFPCFGLCLGELLIRCKDKDKLYTIYLIIGLVGVIITYGSFIYLYPYYTSYYYGDNFYYMGVFNILMNGLIIMFVLSIWYLISKIIPNVLKKYLVFLSKNLTVYYALSWVYVGLLIHLVSYYAISITLIQNIILMILGIVLCSLLTIVFNKIKRSH